MGLLYSLGYCIAHSQCQWVLTVSDEIGEEEVRILVSGASNKQETSARVVVLRGGASRRNLREVVTCLYQYQLRV